MRVSRIPIQSCLKPRHPSAMRGVFGRSAYIQQSLNQLAFLTTLTYDTLLNMWIEYKMYSNI